MSLIFKALNFAAEELFLPCLFLFMTARLY